MAGRATFDAIAAGFRPHHANSVNVAAHCVTTPAGLLAGLNVANQLAGTTWVSTAACVVYALSLLPFLGARLWAANTACVAGLLYAAVAFPLTLPYAVGGIAASYLLQDLAHYACAETTYQSTYQGKKGWHMTLLEHTYFLLPLCLDAVGHTEDSMLSWIVPQNHVLFTKLDNPKETADRKTVNDWVISQSPSTEHTTHWWYEKLPDGPKQAFHDLMTSESMFNMFHEHFKRGLYTVECVPKMNEIYVSSDKHNLNSDTVFYMNHTDGPWDVYPLCGLFRCMMSVNANEQICTRFPFAGKAYTLSEGDCAGFDFNREIHDIHNNEGKHNTGHRITLKCHYVVYPTILKPYGRMLANLTTWYNTAARFTFVNTITPTGFWRLMAWLVLIVTDLRFRTAALVGWTNLTYVALAAGAGYATGDYRVFVGLTSFVHYLKYIGTYNQRRGVSFGQFKRNVMFFKTVAILHLVYLYYKHLEVDPASIALLAAGYSLSISATRALGIDATYFGVELGECAPRFVSSFPYGVIPHPMILGGIVGFLGFHKLEGLRTEMPWLVPMHIGFYLIHCLQEEVFDVYKHAEYREPGAVAGTA